MYIHHVCTHMDINVHTIYTCVRASVCKGNKVKKKTHTHTHQWRTTNSRRPRARTPSSELRATVLRKIAKH